MTGIHATHDALQILWEIPGRGIMMACGDDVPDDDTVGYSKSCIFLHTDAADDTEAVYLNDGTNAAAAFVAIDWTP